MSATSVRLPTQPISESGTVEAGATILSAALLGLAVAISPAGPALVVTALAALICGLYLSSRSGGVHLSFMLIGRIVIFAAFAFVLNAFFTPGEAITVQGIKLPVSLEGIRVGGETALRIVTMVILFRGVVQNLDPIAVVNLVERALAPFRALGLESEKLALIVMIALQVGPGFARETRRLTLQRALRGGWPGPGAPYKERKRRLRLGLRDIPGVLVPLVALALRRAEELAWALPARYFGEGARTSAPPQPWGPSEWVLSVSASLVFVVALLVRVPW